MRDTWDLLKQAQAEGKAVAVSLTPGAKLPAQKRANGRPRVRGATKFGHYDGYRPEKGGRPRCALRGCGNRLRRTQRVACCEEHEKRVVAEAEAILAKVRAA